MSYLFQHKSSYYFRIRIPSDIQPFLGITEIKKSLGKTSRFKAGILAQTLALHLKESFEEIRTHRAMKDGFKLITFEDIQSGNKITIDHGDPEEERRSVEKVQSVLSGFTSKGTTSHSIPLSQLIKEYSDEKTHEGSWSVRTESQSRAKLKNLLEFIHDKPVNDIKHQDSRDYKADLISKGLSNKTINEYLNTASALLNWGIRQGYLETNVFKGISLKHDKKATKGKPFEAEHIQKIFNYPPKLIDPYQYWLPLMAIYSGARIEELAQLYLEDIKQVDGIWLFDISTGKDKRLKTDASARQIPMHSHLIELGLLDYVDLLKANKHERLFPDLNKVKERYSHYASKWFGEYTVKQGAREDKSREYVFHSFRHTVVNFLKQHGFPPEQISAIVGHEKGVGFTLSHYGKKFEPKVLSTLIDALNFGIELEPMTKYRFTGSTYRKLDKKIISV